MPIVPKPYTHVPDTLIEASKVNANDDAMAALVNGGLDNLNIIAGAGIAQSKIANLTNDLGTKKAHADLYRLVNRTEVTLTNYALEYSLTSVVIPAGTMNATDTINGKHVALINSILDGSTLLLRFYWGAAGLVHQCDFTNNSGGTLVNVGLITDFQIFNRNSQSVQGHAFMSSRNDANSGTSMTSTVTGTSENMANSCDFVINVLWNVANVANSVQGLGVELFRQR